MAEHSKGAAPSRCAEPAAVILDRDHAVIDGEVVRIGSGDWRRFVTESCCRD
jgi:hypothetical protein